MSLDEYRFQLKIAFFITIVFVFYFAYIIYPIVITGYDEYESDMSDEYNNKYHMYDNSGELYDDDFKIKFTSVVDTSFYRESTQVYKYDAESNIGYEYMKDDINNLSDENEEFRINEENIYLWNNKVQYKLTNRDIGKNKSDCYVDLVLNGEGTFKKYIFDSRKYSNYKIGNYPLGQYEIGATSFKQSKNNSRIKPVENSYIMKKGNDFTDYDYYLFNIKDSNGSIEIGEFNDEKVVKSANVSVGNHRSARLMFNIIPIWNENSSNYNLKGELTDDTDYNLSIENKNWINKGIMCYKNEYDDSLPNGLKNKLSEKR